MAKKGNFQQKRGIFKHEPLNHARHTSHAESIHICSEQSLTVYSARKCCLILADLALEVDAMTRFPFQRRCPDRLAQSYDYLCVVLAATARALRCMHALSLHGNFTHACMHCVTAVMHNRARATACTSDSRSDIRELSQLPSMPKGKLCTYRLWQLTIFFLLFLLQTDFFWHLIV